MGNQSLIQLLEVITIIVSITAVIQFMNFAFDFIEMLINRHSNILKAVFLGILFTMIWLGSVVIILNFCTVTADTVKQVVGVL